MPIAIGLIKFCSSLCFVRLFYSLSLFTFNSQINACDLSFNQLDFRDKFFVHFINLTSSQS